MGDVRSNHDIWEYLLKLGGWMISISIGVAAKLAFESRRRILSNREKIIKIIISGFIGYLAAVFCDYKGWDEALKIVVPFATLIGESIVEWLMENVKVVISELAKRNFGINNKDNEKNN